MKEIKRAIDNCISVSEPKFGQMYIFADLINQFNLDQKRNTVVCFIKLASVILVTR